MKESLELRPSSRVAFHNENLAGVATLAALLFLAGAGANPAAAQDSVSGGVSTEQSNEDNVSATTDATMSGDEGDCKASAHASASSTSNGETVSRQSEKSVEGPCGKASASAKASSSDSSKGASSNDD